MTQDELQKLISEPETKRDLFREVDDSETVEQMATLLEQEAFEYSIDQGFIIKNGNKYQIGAALKLREYLYKEPPSKTVA